MSQGGSNVGSSNVYEADDQRTIPQAEIDQLKRENRFHEGREHSHKANDSSETRPSSIVLDGLLTSPPTEDERTIANKLAREEKVSTVRAVMKEALDDIRGRVNPITIADSFQA